MLEALELKVEVFAVEHFISQFIVIITEIVQGIRKFFRFDHPPTVGGVCAINWCCSCLIGYARQYLPD